MNSNPHASADCEYVIVGSGAGGGTLAARLAEAGRRVMLLEAGGDPRALAGREPGQPEANRLPDDYDVPVFHTFASENDAIKWDFFVRHYGNDERQRRDSKYRSEWNGKHVDGVLYPRSGTLGGCTAHNAMFLLYPHNADWDEIARLTGDRSWSAENMRGYFERLENCRHRPMQRWLRLLGCNPTRHGWRGWFHTENVLPLDVLHDHSLMSTLLRSAWEACAAIGKTGLKARAEALADPNDWRLVTENTAGIRYATLSTRGHQRMAARERVCETARKYPERLKVELDALATRVIFNEQKRAIGVEYLKGERLYRAHARPSREIGERRELRASREVILAGGTFNTPQLLMLSGIGPREALAKHGIAVREDLAGVGRNLQDRYEIGVVNRMYEDWEVLKGAKFANDDPQYQQWARRRGGVYATNGAAFMVVKRSAPERAVPDLFFFPLLGLFKGYFPGYSALFPKHLNYLTWGILKAHTNNRAGEVTLRSPDPRDAPSIDFRYFEEGDDKTGEDLEAMLDGIKFVRLMTAKLKSDGLITEELPGEQVQSDEELRRFVRDNAWGHHASCTCAIGPREAGGVLDGDFRVHGTRGLRVVDASVFPRIPGAFIVSAVYMIAEKAADVILKDARANT